VFRIVIFLVLTVVLAGALIIGVAGTSAIVKSWIHSDGSLTKFEGHIRHYTDQVVVKGETWYVFHANHPLVLVLGSVGLAWLIFAATAVALRRLLMRRDRAYG
jgi:hypothetical protein